MNTIWILLFTVLASGGDLGGGMGGTYATADDCRADVTAETEATIIASLGLDPSVDMVIHCVEHPIPKAPS